MKISPVVLALLIAVVPARAETTVSVTQEVRDTTIAEIEKQVVALLVTCDYEAPYDIATETRWKSVLEGPNVHLTFSEARKLSFTFSTTGPASLQDVTVKEILLPISAQQSPEYILILFENRVRAFAKYHNLDAVLALQKYLTR